MSTIKKYQKKYVSPEERQETTGELRLKQWNSRRK